MHSKEVKMEGFVKWFSELSKNDVPTAGGKGASLAEMYNIKMPIPPGFMITAQSFDYFLKKTKIDGKIKDILSKLDINDTEKLNKVSKDIRYIIESAELPEEMKEEIVEAYDHLGASSQEKGKNALGVLENSGNLFVAVRSSATTEDLADASFAGQQDSFLNVRGKEELLEFVKKCMSSLFTARAIYYRQKKGFDHNKSFLAVVVQKMINSEKSGVMFTKNPTKGDESIVIEAVWGLGEGIVSGKIKPDHYAIDADLDNFKLLECEISLKKTAIIRDETGHDKEIKLNDEVANRQVLNMHEIKILAQYGRKLEEHYGKPQDIEFAIDKSGVFIVQSRPITIFFKVRNDDQASGNVLLSGMGASPGISSGVVKIVHDLGELQKVKQGDVLVTEMTNPDMVVAMQRAAGIVTDEGGITSHAAIVSREMGIPCVVGTGEATKKLKDGDEITVDGNSGKVFAGRGKTKLKEVEPVVPTKTEIKVIVDLPDYAERAARSKVKAVGLTRMEGIIAEGGKHPMKFVKDKNMNEYVKIIYKGVKKISGYFEEMWVRTSDIRSDEYQHLEGAPQKVEGNPMLGNHGVRFSLKHKDIMKAEIEAIKKVAEEFPHKKFGVMVPQVISLDEVQKTKQIAKEVGVPKNVVIGIMVETPAAVQIIEDICKEGIYFISFGTNDLTQFTLALDRNNEEVQDLYTEMHPAVLKSLSQVIRVCKEYGVKTSICGQAASREEMARFLVGEGINSMSVNADAARKISELVAKLESERSSVVVSYEPEETEYKKEEEKEKKEDKYALVNQARKTRVYDDQDMEELVLKELDKDEYSPGTATENTDVPNLNDAIVLEGELFEDNSKGEEISKNAENPEVLSTEWDGEN